jgi:hypothetical protein
VYPDMKRISLSLPLQIGFSIYTGKVFFINLRLKYHGFTWTIEPDSSEKYDVGKRRLLYESGISPWNFLCIAISAHAGFRF